MPRYYALFAAALIMALPAHRADATTEDPVAVQFEAMAQLVGTWRNAERPDSPLRVRFALTAGGTVLVESWERGTSPHSLTIYHRDGPAIMATHYCPQGNQPRLSSGANSAGEHVTFAFLDAMGLDGTDESHLVELDFDISDPAYILRRERYKSGDDTEDSTLKLVRIP